MNKKLGVITAVLVLVAIALPNYAEAAHNHRHGMYKYHGNTDQGPYPTSRFCERRGKC